MTGLDWLIARPVAHRGLHDAAAGVIENTASAVAAAVAAGYSIEVDLQITADSEAMVCHDRQLGRLTEGNARLDSLSAAELKRVTFNATTDRMLTLGELCDLVAGRSTLILELKSRFDPDPRLPLRVAEVLKTYSGPVAVMSFDPAQMLVMRHVAPHLTRGIVAERAYRPGHQNWAPLVRSWVGLVHQALRSGPQFLAYSVKDLPSFVPLVSRYAMRLPLLTWTVRTPEERQRAARWADQMIFEGFRP
jgi:glycerophosphoryl diester phosphodiesterase